MEEAQGRAVGIIEEARVEHARMRDRLEQLEAALSARDPDKLSATAQNLQAALA